MLYILLITSAFLLVTSNLFAFYAKSPGPWIISLGVVAILGPPFLNIFMLPLALIAVLLMAALGVWNRSNRGPTFFLKLSSGSAVLALGLAGVMASQIEWEYDRLRALYPYQSIESRLPLLRVSLRERPLAPDAEDRLDRLGSRDWDWDWRERRLKKLHEEKVELFINSFGFGYSRMSPRPSAANLYRKRGSGSIQPGPRVSFPTSPGEWLPARPGDEAAMGRRIDQDIRTFANPENFGYVKDRQHVAGFEPHRFSQAPEPVESWKILTLDLVGLLLEPEPRVYVSDRLPSMDQVRAVPTRPLDKIETVALTALRDGDDLWITWVGDCARMVGAIRNNGRCVACHGGDRGDLLGAFSYTLSRAESTSPDPTPR
jgi:hypothetical protein